LNVRRVIGHNVRQARRALGGVDYERFATLLTEFGVEMSGATVLRLETGKRSVKVDELLALASVLDVPPLALLTPPDDERVEFGEGHSLAGDELKAWFSADRLPDAREEVQELRLMVIELASELHELADGVTEMRRRAGGGGVVVVEESNQEADR
jgi:transcriptional regulator with XRE-family HTH domain